MALIDNVKVAIGVFDPVTPTPATIARTVDIQDLINACKEDLKQVGILATVVEAEGPFVVQACKLYVRAMTNYLGKGQEWLARYEGYRDGYSMRQDYIVETEADA